MIRPQRFISQNVNDATGAFDVELVGFGLVAHVTPHGVDDPAAFRALLCASGDMLAALEAMREAYGRLHDFLSDAIEGGRLRESDIPDDYAAFVAQLSGPCQHADDAAKAALTKAKGEA